MSTFITLTSKNTGRHALYNVDNIRFIYENWKSNDSETIIVYDRFFFETVTESLETVKRLIQEAEESKYPKFFCSPTIGDDDIVLFSQTLTDSPN